MRAYWARIEISDIPEARLPAVRQALEEGWSLLELEVTHPAGRAAIIASGSDNLVNAADPDAVAADLVATLERAAGTALTGFVELTDLDGRGGSGRADFGRA